MTAERLTVLQQLRADAISELGDVERELSAAQTTVQRIQVLQRHYAGHLTILDAKIRAEEQVPRDAVPVPEPAMEPASEPELVPQEFQRCEDALNAVRYATGELQRVLASPDASSFEVAQAQLGVQEATYNLTLASYNEAFEVRSRSRVPEPDHSEAEPIAEM